jgi:hypothetical protein
MGWGEDFNNWLQTWAPRTESGTVELNAGDYALNALTGGIYGTAKGYGQTGDLGHAMLATYMSPAYGLASAATGRFGYDDRVASQEAGALAEGPINDAMLANQGILGPYNEAGMRALEQQQALMGLLGPEAQAAAQQAIQAGPQFGEMVRQSEMGILSNAAATGGLRGGNTQAALMQNRPNILTQLINQQLQGLAGLSGQGLQAGGQQAGLNTGLQTDLAGIRSGTRLGEAQAARDTRQTLIDLGGTALGAAGKVAGAVATGGASLATPGIV